MSILIMVILFVIGLAVMAGIWAIENMAVKGVLAVVLLILIGLEKLIFDFAIPTGQDEILRQNNKCVVSYYSPGCPGYRSDP
jgi:hypothetical protein